MERRRNIAVVLAGGSGRRLGGDMPKQFLTIAGRRVVEYTIDVFERNAAINEVAVVVNPLYLSLMREIVESNRWTKVHQLLQGGEERYLSTLSAIEAYKGCGPCNLIFHDAVRPLVSDRVISDVVEALERHDAVGVAVPLTDTLFKMREHSDEVEAVPPRNLLRRAQTPQAFRYEVIAEAYRKALSDKDFTTTDDCSVVLRYMPEVSIHVVEGDESNIKLTYRDDITLIEQFLEKKKTTSND